MLSGAPLRYAAKLSLSGEETEESGISKDLCRYTTDQSLIFQTERLVSKKKKKEEEKRFLFFKCVCVGGGGGWRNRWKDSRHNKTNN